MEKVERTPEDYVNEMLAKGRDWIAIIAVARGVRDGRWYDQTRDLLQAKGLMPKDPEIVKKMKEDAAKVVIPDEPKIKRPTMTPEMKHKIMERRAQQIVTESADPKD